MKFRVSDERKSYLTQTKRRLIQYMLDNKIDAAHTPRINARMEAVADNVYKVTFLTQEQDDWGRKFVRRQIVEITVL